MNNKEPTSFEMKIANRMKKNKAGCYPFSEASINNIPNIDIFTDDKINREITEACKSVLRQSMSSKNPYRYGEVGILMSILDVDAYGNKLPTIRKGFKGTYNRIQMDDNFKEIVRNRGIMDLVLIHNHPNNSKFSVADIKLFASNKNILCIIAVGNRSNIFTLIKADRSKSANIDTYINEYVKNRCRTNSKEEVRKYEEEVRKYEEEVISEILRDTDEFGLIYRRLYRKNKED